VEVRREQPFELLLEGRWVSGVFDRVALRGDGGGGERQAEILDFKSDRVDDEASLNRAVESHRAQMQLYRKALAHITGIPPDRISTLLLFTSSPRIVTLSSPSG
jgi:ATP-dependent exoDNAse (exonuclease V) beta subunit